MRRLATLLAGLAVSVGAAVLAAVIFLPVPPRRALDGYLLFAGGLLLLGLVTATRTAGGPAGESLYERALRRRRLRPERPAALIRTERAVSLAAATSFDVHRRVRPLLREIAEHRLWAGRGLELDSGGPEVRSALGEPLWELLRPGREAPDDRFQPGLRPAELAAALDTLERI
ncbi:MAG: hypothetical protein H0V40_06550 [Actinobacteria bacterium]|nr:hypothetical protein [Actinomycetota bacterium]